MKTLSVLLTLALLLVADQLASGMKRAGALPIATRQSPTAHQGASPHFTQALPQTFNRSIKNTF